MVPDVSGCPRAQPPAPISVWPASQVARVNPSSASNSLTARFLVVSGVQRFKRAALQGISPTVLLPVYRR